VRTYYWDFFGPTADGTAAHFKKHLEEFLSKHSLDSCAVSLLSLQPGHCAAACIATDEARERIEKALRPRRWTDSVGLAS
jgi:uncharacterized protein